MPKKRQSQPIQVWLAKSILLRLQNASKRTSRTQSEIARQAITLALDALEKEFEKEDKERLEKNVQRILFERFSTDSLKLISLAKVEAESKQSMLIGSEHLLLALVVGRTGKLLSKFGLTQSLVRGRIASGFPSIYSEITTQPYSPTFIRILDRSRLIAKRFHDKYVQPEHLLFSVLDQGTGFAYNILELLGVPRDEVFEALKTELLKLRQDPRWNQKA
jgi:ATP-dependent Clp protease ATP-binding subunit ClpA